MKFLIVVALLVSVASAGEVLDRLNAALQKLNIPADRLAKMQAALNTTGKECYKKIADTTDAQLLQTTNDAIFKAMDDCTVTIKDIPVAEYDRRRDIYRACLREKFTKGDLSEDQKKIVAQLDQCFFSDSPDTQ